MRLKLSHGSNVTSASELNIRQRSQCSDLSLGRYQQMGCDPSHKQLCFEARRLLAMHAFALKSEAECIPTLSWKQRKLPLSRNKKGERLSARPFLSCVTL